MQFDVGWNLDLRFCKEASFSGKDNVIKSKWCMHECIILCWITFMLEGLPLGFMGLATWGPQPHHVFTRYAARSYAGCVPLWFKDMQWKKPKYHYMNVIWDI
jgi:hypothetical protein